MKYLLVTILWALCFSGVTQTRKIVNKSHPLAQGLNGCYVLEDGGGIALDKMGGLGSIGFLENGASYTNTDKGVAVSFDGSNDDIKLGNDPDTRSSLAITGAITIVALIKPTDLVNYNGILGKTGIINTNIGGTYDFYLEQSTGKPTCVRGCGCGSTQFTHFDYKVATTGVTAGVWSQVAVTCTGGNNGVMTFYTNGIINGSASYSFSNASTDANQPAYIGSRLSGVTRFKGFIKYVYIYNRALSIAEIQQLYADPYCMFLKNE